MRWMGRVAGTLAMIAACARVTMAAGTCPTPDVLIGVRQAAAAACPCDATRSAYRRCNRDFMQATRPTVSLANQCWRDFRSAVSQSICGRPGRVACCVPSAHGGRQCKIVTAGSCTDRGGCASDADSCADACTGSDTGCPAPPTCGNGVIEGAEGCDGGSFCTPQCQLRYFWCCQYPAPFCSIAASEFVPDQLAFESCGALGGTFRLGATPASDPSCQPLVPSSAGNGACVDTILPAPITLCCESATPECRETTSADGPTLLAFSHDCFYAGFVRSVEGTCSAAGTCVPAH